MNLFMALTTTCFVLRSEDSGSIRMRAWPSGSKLVSQSRLRIAWAEGMSASLPLTTSMLQQAAHFDASVEWQQANTSAAPTQTLSHAGCRRDLPSIDDTGVLQGLVELS